MSPSFSWSMTNRTSRCCFAAFRRDSRDLRAGRFTMEFAQSGPAALQRIRDTAGVSLILILSDINMPGMSGLELLPKAATGCTGDHDHRLGYLDYLGTL
jgi:DNA-binding NarL/FixJ family response regulator